MPKKILFAILLTLSANSLAADKPAVQKYVVSFPDKDTVEYKGEFSASFPKGLPIGIGSGLYFEGEKDGVLSFVTLTDRGPNADSPKLDDKATKVFVTPGYAPLLMKIKVDAEGATATDPVSIKEEGKPVSGLPLSPDMIGSTHEVPLDENLEVLGTDNRGLDPEGIVSDGEGGYWISDEYGPFIMHLNKEGNIVQKLGPTPEDNEPAVASGLPNIIKWRQANRGFEGIARLPDGTIVAAVQSTLDIDGKTAKTAQVTRLVTYNPQTGDTRMFAYPIDTKKYKSSKKAKIGDVVAIDQNHLLILEQGDLKKGGMHNTIYKIDISGATDLTETDKEQPIEFNTAKEIKARKIKLVKKTKVVDLRDLGWEQEKAEGLALINDHRFAVINDNDFGVKTVLVGGKKGDDIDDYELDSSGALTRDGVRTTARIEVKPLRKLERRSDLWIVTVPESLND